MTSRTLEKLLENNSTHLRGDVVAAVAALKSQAGLDLQIIGSASLIQTLQRASLIGASRAECEGDRMPREAGARGGLTFHDNLRLAADS